MAHRTSCGWYDDGWGNGEGKVRRHRQHSRHKCTHTSLLGLAPTLPRNILLPAFAPATANAHMHVFVACRLALCAVSCSNRCLPMGSPRRSLLHSLLADGLCALFVAPFVSGRWAPCAVRCSIHCLPMSSPRRSFLHSLHVDGLRAQFVAPFVACRFASRVVRCSIRCMKMGFVRRSLLHSLPHGPMDCLSLGPNGLRAALTCHPTPPINTNLHHDHDPPNLLRVVR